VYFRVKLVVESENDKIKAIKAEKNGEKIQCSLKMVHISFSAFLQFFLCKCNKKEMITFFFSFFLNS